MKITQTETVAPTSDPVTLAEVKAWIRVDQSDDDATITTLIKMATSNIERRLAHRLAGRTVVFGFERFTDIMRLPLSPIGGVAEVSYLDENGVRQILDPATYQAATSTLAPTVHRHPDHAWPSHKGEIDSVKITCNVGYQSQDAIPADLKHAIAVMVSDHYDNRQGATASERAVSELLASYRNAWVA